MINLPFFFALVKTFTEFSYASSTYRRNNIILDVVVFRKLYCKLLSRLKNNRILSRKVLLYTLPPLSFQAS